MLGTAAAAYAVGPTEDIGGLSSHFLDKQEAVERVHEALVVVKQLPSACSVLLRMRQSHLCACPSGRPSAYAGCSCPQTAAQ
jgi:hypothetical protein